jgi:NAD+ kinase
VNQRTVDPVKLVMLYPREDGPAAWGATQLAAQWLSERGVEVAVPTTLLEMGKLDLPPGCLGVGPGEIPDHMGLMIALGGDGTLLRASRWVAEEEIPVVGVNLGDLGFLSAFSREDLEILLADAVAGELVWEPRLRMDIAVEREVDGEKRMATAAAVNDAYIKHGEIPRLLRLATYVGDQYMATYKADGLIVCTPLGSTAYNLAAGGPILAPMTNAFTITPICPHSLTHRPVVTCATTPVRIVYAGPEDVSSAFLTADGQWNLELQVGDEITITAAEKPLRLVPARASVFQVLSAKLGWSQEGGEPPAS